jgi:hypothetical protein
MVHPQIHALKLITETKILIPQLFVLDAKTFHFMMLVASPASTNSRLAQVHKKAGDKNADD